MSWQDDIEAPEVVVEYAAWHIRLLALIIDWLILIIPSILVTRLIGTPGAWVVQYAYFVYFTGSTGQTLGKKAMSIKVVKVGGGPMEYGTAAMREILGKLVSSLILGIGYLFPLWDERKQALHDKIAGTLVIVDRQV